MKDKRRRRVPISLVEEVKAKDQPVQELAGLTAFPGCMVRARLIGVIEAKHTQVHGPWIRNDRLLAVQTNSLQYSRIATWRNLPKKTRDQIDAFFKFYNQAKGKRFAVIKWRGCPTAYQLIRNQLVA